MASVQVQVYHGCIVAWKKVVPKDTTVGELRMLMTADPQSFRDRDLLKRVDFRRTREGCVLKETAAVGEKLFAKKRDQYSWGQLRSSSRSSWVPKEKVNEVNDTAIAELQEIAKAQEIAAIKARLAELEEEEEEEEDVFKPKERASKK